MNTKLTYLYRDACNYKVLNEEVIEGDITPEQVDSVMACLDEGTYFIPRQVGLPETRFEDSPTEDDHSWFEMEKTGLAGFEATDEGATVNMTIEELVAKFQAAKDNWQVHDDYPSYYGAE